MSTTMFQRGGLLLALATLATAQYGPPSGSGYNGGNPYADGDDNGDSSSSPFNDRGGFGRGSRGSASTIIHAHAILASLAFILFFPLGGILIRIASFPRLWLAHAAVQIIAWVFYIIGFGIGIWMTVNHFTFKNAHPIIGIALFWLLALQPILGIVHHVMFKKHARRVVWSYVHIWLGRIIIFGGIINGGLGLRLARQERFMAPGTGAVAGYAVAAVLMGGAYVASIVIGERRRKSPARSNPPPYKEVRNNYEMGAPGRSAGYTGTPDGVGEYYKGLRSGQQYS